MNAVVGGLAGCGPSPRKGSVRTDDCSGAFGAAYRNEKDSDVHHGVLKTKYSPFDFKGLTFHDVVPSFLKGQDSPRDYLERCLETIADREPVVQGWSWVNQEGARAAASASTERYRKGQPLSRIDGMVIGIKDIYETKDMPTQFGSSAFAGHFPKRDSAFVQALRDAGAVILGKTVPTELGLNDPGPTTNPFDPQRTPGGSSSGSAAAVGARMAPATIGSQLGGSIIRPASYCGNYALKPSQGALHRGERQGQSHSVIGVHAGSLEDMWHVAIEIAERVGGDPGHPGICGPSDVPVARKPERLILLETEGWGIVDAWSRSALEAVVERLETHGVTVLRRKDDPLIDALEVSIANFNADIDKVRAFEAFWTMRNLNEYLKGELSPRVRDLYERDGQVTRDAYRFGLQKREEARRRCADVAPLADGFITLSSTGIAPIWKRDVEGRPFEKRPTGDISFNSPASGLGTPAVTVPLMAVDGMPLGLQVMGQRDADASVVGLARWISTNIEPVVM